MKFFFRLFFFKNNFFVSFSYENFYKNSKKFEKQKIPAYNSIFILSKKIIKKKFFLKFHLEIENVSFGPYLDQKKN